MVASTPTNELTLVASSMAEHAAFIALRDVAILCSRVELEGAMLIGGHMVSLHAQEYRRG